MTIAPKEITQRITSFEEACRKQGAKLTHQRIEIFREVLEAGNHPDVDQVFHGVRRRISTVSLDTVYRTLWWLKDLGLVTTLGLSRERARFDANLSRHHHFVCTLCGLTQDFYSDVFDKLNLPDSVKSFGAAERIQVEVKGCCMNCAANDNRAQKTREERKVYERREQLPCNGQNPQTHFQRR